MLAYVIEDLVVTIKLNGLQSIIGGMIFIVGYLFVKFLYWKVYGISKKSKGVNLLTKYLIVCYLIYVFYIVLYSREPGSRETVNLTFFGTYSASPRAQAYMFENILLFIPFGFLLPLLSKRLNRFTSTLILGMTFSLIIETLQFITQRGYFQLDDIWLNTVGSILGFCAAFGFLQVFTSYFNQKNMPLQ